MTEGITSDLIQLLMDREGYTLPGLPFTKRADCFSTLA